MEEPAPIEIVGISDNGKHVLFDAHYEEVTFDFFVRLLEQREIFILECVPYLTYDCDHGHELVHIALQVLFIHTVI